MYKLWIDDERKAPEGFNLVAINYDEAIQILSKYKGFLNMVSFDHDLGEGKTGYDVLSWLEKAIVIENYPEMDIEIHTANPTGRSRMISAAKSCYRFWNRTDLPKIRY